MKDWDAVRSNLRSLQLETEANVLELIRVSTCVTNDETGVATRATDLHAEIGKQLDRATAVIRGLQPSATDATQGPQLRRFQEIFLGLSREATNAFSAYEKKCKQHSLLNTAVSRHLDDEACLLRERNALDSSLETLSTTLAQGRETHANVRSQSSSVRAISSKLAGVGSQLPGAEQMISRIRHAKLKEQIVLATTTAVCLLIVLFYILGK